MLKYVLFGFGLLASGTAWAGETESLARAYREQSVSCTDQMAQLVAKANVAIEERDAKAAKLEAYWKAYVTPKAH